MMINDAFSQADAFSNEYYGIRVSSREARPGMWFARATVERKDSGETVGGIQRSGDTQEQALASLDGEIMKYVASLSAPPYQWGRIELRNLLVDYRKFNDQLTEILVALEKERQKNGLSDTSLHNEFWKARESSIKGAVMLAHRLAKLPEQDQIDLMTSAESTYADQTDAWNIDDIDSRNALFEFIADPSEGVIRAHDAHQKRQVGSRD